MLEEDFGNALDEDAETELDEYFVVELEDFTTELEEFFATELELSYWGKSRSLPVEESSPQATKLAA